MACAAWGRDVGSRPLAWPLSWPCWPESSEDCSAIRVAKKSAAKRLDGLDAGKLGAVGEPVWVEDVAEPIGRFCPAEPSVEFVFALASVLAALNRDCI